MRTWEFSDNTTGEDFFVEAETKEEAIEIAEKYFYEPECFGEVSEEFTELMGWDTY